MAHRTDCTRLGMTYAVKRSLPNRCLSVNPPEEDEINILLRKQMSAPATVQRISFTGLPPEIRNRIYELALPSKDEELIVATPFQDEAMSLATQPAITRVSRQLRLETLKMFYTECIFVAYIDHFDFLRFIHWARCITSGSPPPYEVTVHVKLLSRLGCIYDLLELVREWRAITHTTLHLRVHNCYAGGPVLRQPGFDQREIMVQAICAAEKLRQQGNFEGVKLVAEYQGLTEGINGRVPICQYGDLCVFHRSSSLERNRVRNETGYFELARAHW